MHKNMPFSVDFTSRYVTNALSVSWRVQNIFPPFNFATDFYICKLSVSVTLMKIFIQQSV